MNFHELVQHVFDDTLAISLPAFRPEMVLCATIVALLLVRMIVPRWLSGPTILTLTGCSLAMWLLAPWRYFCHFFADGTDTFAGETFTGMLQVDGFGVFMRALLIAFVILFVIFTRITRFPHRLDTAEFFVLVLGATVGMCLMVSANHMMIVFLGVEMASVPSYILAGMMKENRRASEAALKYSVYGAAAAGIMIYGISLLCGTLGTAQLPAMAAALAELLQTPTASSSYMILVLGGLMLTVGVAFKLSAVPFHFWAPDVFEGAPAEIAAFLSIASKAAALGLLVRLAIGLGYSPEPEALATLAPVRTFIVATIGVMAAVTCTFGNLAAYGQISMKRLLAYSTIAHAGYMMMP
ncbi:MAG: NADH-quinone oxidoreductase subunit N, partial [Pirellulales bacterium]|nr:NADH-quinone oxidoreductase subunit N [Pirellulales bacterium]